MEKNEPQIPQTPRKILVTGDYGLDYNLYLADEHAPVPENNSSARLVTSLGGAGIIHRLLKEASQLKLKDGQVPFEVGFARGAEGSQMIAPPMSALWKPFPMGKLNTSDPKKERKKVWRLAHSLRLNKALGLPLAEDVTPPENSGDNYNPDILVVEDDWAGFRFPVESRIWHKALKEPGDSPHWIILKMTAPVCQGDIWWHLMQNQGLRDRLIVVLTTADLRRENLRVSKGISWERTAIDLYREINESPSLLNLRDARHVIVVLDGEGAFWMERSKDDSTRKFHLIFDPEHMVHEEWADSIGLKGGTYGFGSCFTSAIAAHMAMFKGIADITSQAIQQALRTMRILRIAGHGLTDGDQPELPYAHIARTIVGDQMADMDKSSCETAIEELISNCEKIWKFGHVVIPDDVIQREKEAHRWQILEESDHIDNPEKTREPLFGVAKRIALWGLKEHISAPIAKFGKLVTVDRDEIEALNNLKQLIRDYHLKSANNPKPLSIAVFGPPGAGKSFGIEQISGEILGDKTPFLVFNLSQFNGVTDLIGAFHQVRDKVLEGHTPVVFWDEFDSGNYKWLQYLLAPMQDGKFQEGQITHPIGKSIFVFAGATSFDFENFGPPEPTCGQTDKNTAWNEFKLLKGPDFKSRLNGYLNVLGPNRRQLYAPDCPETSPWKDDPSDICFPVRRALLLRVWLNAGDSKLNIDRGLLSALLEVDRYTFGARSFEKIVESLHRQDPAGISRSQLPHDEIIRMNTKLSNFKSILTRAEDYQRLAHELAPAIHGKYCEFSSGQNSKVDYDELFDKLPLDIKADNVAAACRIPWILELAGLFLKRKTELSETSDPGVPKILHELIEVLAEEEHDLWMAFRIQQGWKLGKEKDIHKRIQHCLRPYRELEEIEQNKDRQAVLNFPEIANLAGFCIATNRPS